MLNLVITECKVLRGSDMFKYLDFTEVADLIIKNKNVNDSSKKYIQKSVLDFIRQARIEPCFYYKGYLRALIKGDFSSTIDEARFLFEGYIRPPTGTVHNFLVQYDAYRECPWKTLLGNTAKDSNDLWIQEVDIAEVIDLQEQHDEYYLDRKRQPFDFAKANKLYIEPQTYNYDELYFSSTSTKAVLTTLDQAHNTDLAQELRKANIKIEELGSQLAQVEAELADKPTDDKDLAPNSQAKVTHMLYAILKEHRYDLSPPKGKGVANDQIVAASRSHKSPVTRNFVANWLERVHQLDIDLKK